MDCGRYTLRKDSCPCCGGKLHIPHPAKFSPEDKYAEYKGMMRNLTYERDDRG